MLLLMGYIVSSYRFVIGGLSGHLKDSYSWHAEACEAILEEFELDPLTYEEAINDVNADRQVKVMEPELKSIYLNQLWELGKVSNSII
jgi:hypothetical protein